MTESPLITQRTAFKPAAGQGVLASNYFVAIDLETTGVSAETNAIVELGAVKMSPDGSVRDRFSMIVNPGANVPLPPAAQRVHKITAQQVRSAPPLNEGLDAFAEFIGGCGVLAHNLGFEKRFLTEAYRRRGGPLPHWQGLCTLATARKHITAESHALAKLLDLLGLPADNTHRAADDAYACGLLAAYMISKMNVSALEPLPPVGPDATTGSADDAIGLLRQELGATVITPAAAGSGAARPPFPEFRPAPATGPEPARPEPASDPDSGVRDAFGGHTPTSEQERALALFQEGGSLKLVAVAGSGKTSTLRAFARTEQVRRPGRHLLYLAFNRSVAHEAAAEFPDNTTAMTIHAMARRQILNTAYGPLLGKLNTELPPWSATSAAIMPRKVVVDTAAGARVLSAYAVGRIALETVEMFCRTVDDKISAKHLPPVTGIDVGTAAHAQLAEVVVPCARRAWKHVLDPNSFAVRFTHSAYLKLFADMRPTVGNPGDALLFDEAQDANPLTAQIVADQTHLQRCYVGDSAQSIYSFTGAVDSLRKFDADHTATLTQSFRFGDAIAEAANVYLDLLGETVRVRGNPAIDDVVDWTMTDVTATLSRTNAGALEAIVTAQKNGRSAAFIGDTDDALKFTRVARSLKAGKEPSDPKFAAFTTWSQLMEYVEQQPGGGELATYTKLVEERGVDDMESALKNLVHPKRADVIFATAHKSKGLEFDRVKIADDFTVDTDGVDGAPPPTAEEIAEARRLAYVALTRARTALNPGHLLTPQELSAQRAAPAGMLL